MSFDIGEAREFVKSVDLRGTRRGLVAQSADKDASIVFDEAKQQAQVIGAGLFSFGVGVDETVREGISDSALLAQLVANKKASAEADPRGWFAAYSEVLQNVGWVLEEAGWTRQAATGNQLEVHEQIIGLLTVALGPGAAAVSILTAAMTALSAMQPDSPWITLFSRESEQARVARFQVGVVESTEKGVVVSMIGCLVEADTTITQVLFFKFKQSNASFDANHAKVSINEAALRDLGPAIRGKVRAYQADYLSSIVDI